MYINFQQNRVNRSVITVHTNVFAKNCKLHKFATTNSIFFFKSTLSDMHHRKTYMYINFQQNRVTNKNGQKRAYKFICEKIASCINLQLLFGKNYKLIYKLLYKSE